MSDPVVTPAAPVVNIDPSNAKATPPPAPPPNVAPPAEGDPAWLAPRLEQAKRAALKDLGFESPEAAKKAADAAKAAEEANKTEAEKRIAAEKALEKTNKRLEEQGKALTAYANAQMAALDDKQKAAVLKIAGDDPSKQLTAIETLKPTWASEAAPAANASDGKPADTLPPREAPKGINPNEGAPNLQAIYDEWKDVNPVWAARFALNNGLFEKK